MKLWELILFIPLIIITFIISLITLGRYLPNFIQIILNANISSWQDVKDVLEISYKTHKYDRKE